MIFIYKYFYIQIMVLMIPSGYNNKKYLWVIVSRYC